MGFIHQILCTIGLHEYAEGYFGKLKFCRRCDWFKVTW